MQIHISKNGKQLGPFDEKELTEQITKGVVSYDDLAWTEGLAQWQPLRSICTPPARTGPPPLMGSAVNNGLVWTVAFVPIIGVILQYFIAGAFNATPSDLWFISLALNIALCVVDDKILKNAGHNTENFGAMAWLVPVYLFKRARTLNQPLSYFVTWMVCFFVSLFL